MVDFSSGGNGHFIFADLIGSLNFYWAHRTVVLSMAVTSFVLKQLSALFQSSIILKVDSCY